MSVPNRQLWWILFTNDDDINNEEFLGACIVRASGHKDAIYTAYTLGLYPGGAANVFGPLQPPPEMVGLIESHMNKLMDEETCRKLNQYCKPN